MAINLGDKAKDSISGFSGIVTGRYCYLNGCIRLCIEPDHLDKDGKHMEGKIFDEPQCELVETAVRRLPVATVGGPRSDPSPRSAPTR